MTDHRCQCSSACRRPDTSDQRQGALIEAQTGICDPCRRHLESCAKQLPHDWLELYAALGARNATGNDKVRSTPTPAIPISVAREALMSQILELAELAAATIADQLDIEQPTGRRPKPPPILLNGEVRELQPGSTAAQASEASHPDDYRRLTAACALIEREIELLVAAPTQPVNVWSRPGRCPEHGARILEAETDLATKLKMPAADTADPKQVKAWLRQRFRAKAHLGTKRIRLPMPPKAAAAMETLRLAYTAAATCDHCNAWNPNPRLGQARHIDDIAGIDIALTIVELHNRTRADLGKTRLRRRYTMPCPRCGGDVGQDEPTPYRPSVVDCRDCGGSWTEGEYKFLAGLITEGKEMDIVKWLLAESYSRLDHIQEFVTKLATAGVDPETGVPRIDLPGAGTVILEALTELIEAHQPPAERAIATEKAATEQRQEDHDRWSWSGEKPYRAPKRKHRKAVRPPGAPQPAPIAKSSLTLVNDTEPDETTDLSRKCKCCNEIHKGECA